MFVGEVPYLSSLGPRLKLAADEAADAGQHSSGLFLPEATFFLAIGLDGVFHGVIPGRIPSGVVTASAGRAKETSAAAKTVSADPVALQAADGPGSRGRNVQADGTSD